MIHKDTKKQTLPEMKNKTFVSTIKFLIRFVDDCFLQNYL